MELVIVIIIGVLIYVGFFYFLIRFLLNRIKVKRLRDFKCIFTGEYMEGAVTRDTGYQQPDREVRYARVWAGELQIDENTTTIKGEYVHGDVDRVLTSPALGYKVSRTEDTFYKNALPDWMADSEDSTIKKKGIEFKIVSFGKLSDKQKKTLEKVVKAASYTY